MSSVALLHKLKSKGGFGLYYTGTQGLHLQIICMRIMALGREANRCFPRKHIYGVPHLKLDLSLSRKLEI